MVFKRVFGKDPKPSPKEYSIEDLIVLEKWDEAIARLQAKTKANPHDLHSHLRLAEVYVQTRQALKALDEYFFVADLYTEDGFYDKSIALLTKAGRLAPADPTVPAKIQRNQRLKSLEHSRVLALEGLVESQQERSPLAKSSPVEIQRLWQSLAATKIVQVLPGDQLRRLFANTEIVLFEEKQVLAERGSLEEVLYLLIDGEVEAILVLPESGGMQVRSFGAGDIVGEGALLEHRPWPAAYRAKQRTRALLLNREGLERALVGNPDPRGLLEALRGQRNDRSIATAAERLLGPQG
jgi:CRP-like cAMP-binding protein